MCLQYLVEWLFSHSSWTLLAQRARARDSPILEKRILPVEMRSCNSNVRTGKLSSFGDVLCSSELQFAAIERPPRVGHARVINNGNGGFKADSSCDYSISCRIRLVGSKQRVVHGQIIVEKLYQSDNFLIHILSYNLQ